MRVLPAWLQPWLTELTGKALPGEKPWFRWSRGGRLVATLVEFIVGVGGSFAFALAGGSYLALLPITWLLTVSASRTMQTGAGVHHASHGNLLRSKWLNDFVGEALSLLTWIQPLSLYRKDHGPHHWQTGTEADADLQFLSRFAGLKPGRTVAEYWRQFGRVMFSPRFHAQFFAARLHTNLVKAPRVRRIAGWIWLLFLVGLLVFSGMVGPWLVAYFIPIVVFHQMSAWAGLLGLHQWVRLGDGSLPKKEVLAGLTSGRFVGEAAPDATLTGWHAARAWSRWTLRMLFIHLAARLAVVPGDLPSHDWHHFKPESPDWPNHAYARRDDATGKGPNAKLYTEIWGIGAAINATFERLAALPQKAHLGKPVTYRQVRNVFLGM